MRNRKLFQRLMAVVMCSTLLATTPIMTYATTNTTEVSSEIATQAEADENGFVIEDGVLVKYTGNATDVVIPSGVTSIEPNAFKKETGESKFESITIPGTVKCIESGTFDYSISVKKLILEEGVETIGHVKNLSLVDIVIPSSVTDIGNIIGADFSTVGGVRRYGLDIYVNKGSYAETFFSENGSRANILSVYDNGCVSIQYGKEKTLIEYQGTSEKVTIPEDVEVIWGGFYAYHNTNFVSEISLPEKLTAIKSGAFADTVWIENLRKENPVVVVDNWLLDARTATGEVIIPENVTQIADGAFYENKEVTKVVIPDGVTKIGCEMFTDCSSLTEVVIPSSVTVVEGDGLDFSEPFIGCESLTTIHYIGTKAQWNAIDWDIPTDTYRFYGCPGITVNCTDGSITYDTEGNIVEDTSAQDTLDFAWEDSWKVKMKFPKDYEGRAQFSVNVYNKDGSQVGFKFGKFTKESADAEGYVYLDMSDAITENGKYYAKIAIRNEDSFESNEIYITGETPLQEYVAPKAQLAIPANVAFNENGILSFELVEGAVLYKVKVDSDGAILDLYESSVTFTNEDSKDGKTITWDIEKCIEDCRKNAEKGYYDKDTNFTVTVQAFSEDINTIRNSEISEGVVYEYIYFKSEDVVLDDFNKALEDEDMPYAIEVLRNVKNEMLTEMLQTDAAFVKKVAELETEYQKEYNITVTSKSEVKEIDASKVSIVGGVLNAASNYGVVELSIKTPENAVEVPSKYSNGLPLDITLLINEKTQEDLTIPVTITMPIPDGVSKENLVILHYHANAAEPIVITPIINTDGTMTFIVDGFSTFVVANDMSETANNGNNNSNNNGNNNSDNTGNSDNNGKDDSDAKSPDTGDTSVVFANIVLGMSVALLVVYKKIKKAY